MSIAKCLIQEWLSPYEAQTLSAYDNAKLAYTVLKQHDVGVTAYEASCVFGTNSDTCQIYCLQCNDEWINCGMTNDYAAKISEMALSEIELLSHQRPLSLPLLGEQQIVALMMQYAHFDHC